MSTIRILPSGKWNAQVRVGGKKPKSKSFDTKKNAEIWATKLENKLRNISQSVPKTAPSWEDLALQYCGEMLMGKPSQKQTICKIGVIGRSPFIRKPLNAITSKDINFCKIQRLKKVGPIPLFL